MDNTLPKRIVFDAKMIVSSFLAGTGIILWVVSFVFNPINSVKTDIALIQKDISIINTNHEAHIQDIMQELKKIKEDEVMLEKNIAVSNQILIDHLNMTKATSASH